MENKDKEAIYKGALRKQLNGRDLDSPAVQAYLNSYQTLAAYEAMESYSASQNEELIKENEGLNRVISKLFADKVEETRQLQSTIDELQKDLNSYKEAFENNKEQFMELATHARDLESTINEKNKELEILRQNILDGLKNESWQFKEIERLKGLLKKQIHCGGNCNSCNEIWQAYATENNL